MEMGWRKESQRDYGKIDDRSASNYLGGDAGHRARFGPCSRASCMLGHVDSAYFAPQLRLCLANS